MPTSRLNMGPAKHAASAMGGLILLLMVVSAAMSGRAMPHAISVKPRSENDTSFSTPRAMKIPTIS